MKRMRGLLLAISAAVLAGSPAQAADLGDPAPELKIATWVKGDPVTLADGKGKQIRIVEFWATWCGPCRITIPHLTEMQKKYKDKGVVVIGVSVDQNQAAVAPFVKEWGKKMEYTVAIDNNHETATAYMDAYGMDGIPAAFVVDQENRIVWYDYPSDPANKIEHVIDQLIEKKFDLKAAKELKAAQRKEAEEAAKKMEALRAAFAKYFDLVGTDGDAAEAAKFGEQLVRENQDNAGFLNSLAWNILTDEDVAHRDRELALRAAKLANDALKGENASVLDTYARALFDTGDKGQAIMLQKKVVAMSADDPRMQAEAQKTLERYMQAAGGG